MKKFSCISYLLLILVFSCSYTFPDKVVDWKKIDAYTTEKLEFNRTSLQEVKQLVPEAQVHDLGDNITIISTRPENSDVFTFVNIGFRKETLDWLEFILKEPIEVSEFVTLYGFPGIVDSEYSPDMDYYSYETFNIATDKNHQVAKSITIFANKKPAPEKKPKSVSKTGFFTAFPGLVPGALSEEYFMKNYPELLPYTEEEFDVNSTYTLTEELGTAAQRYKKAVLKFENGLLDWVNLVPVENDLNTILRNVGETYRVEIINDDYDFYVFKNFVLVVNKENKTVSNIGLTNYDKRF